MRRNPTLTTNENGPAAVARPMIHFTSSSTAGTTPRIIMETTHNDPD